MVSKVNKVQKTGTILKKKENKTCAVKKKEWTGSNKHRISLIANAK